MTEPFYITTPIYYVNAQPHLGHAYTTIAADVSCRYNFMEQKDVYFQTGTDEHGDKIERAARDEGIGVKDYVDKISGLFKNLWPELKIQYNYFIRTTDASHIKLVRELLQRIYDAEDIYFHEYEGLYCFGCEQFYAERELVNGKCPDHNTEPELIKESNYFFKMGKYQDWLIDHIESNPDFIRPKRYKNEVLAFLREPLEDLCISRPKSRLKWGIPLPFDNDYVTYVWFDALINYISGLGYPDGDLFSKFWPSAQHIIAKDILKPHGIYWPIMLKAAGIDIYKHLNVHGYWNIGENKMSKSIGNVIEPLSLIKKYGIESFRFFLMREMTFGLDSNFSEKSLIERINSDLANDLGNLFSRVLSMAHKYFSGIVPHIDMDVEDSFQFSLEEEAVEAVEKFQISMDVFAFHGGIAAIWGLIRRMNKYIDVTSPWELAKKKSAKKQLEIVIYNLIEGLRVVSGLIYPVMPDTSVAMQKHLGLNTDEVLKGKFNYIDELKKWNVTKPGTKLLKSIRLFPRIEV